MPEAQTLFTVVHGTLQGSPAPITACLAGAWPTPALTTLPRNAVRREDGVRNEETTPPTRQQRAMATPSSMSLPSIPARSTAARMA
eukprot:scaffold803_cov310-Pinguiococcus_pyrenoidosus.AAC.30